jgi:predicted  nucleic acid-binding Zn-ribbon protein
MVKSRCIDHAKESNMVHLGEQLSKREYMASQTVKKLHGKLAEAEKAKEDLQRQLTRAKQDAEQQAQKIAAAQNTEEQLQGKLDEMISVTTVCMMLTTSYLDRTIKDDA